MIMRVGPKSRLNALRGKRVPIHGDLSAARLERSVRIGHLNNVFTAGRAFRPERPRDYSPGWQPWGGRPQTKRALKAARRTLLAQCHESKSERMPQMKKRGESHP